MSDLKNCGCGDQPTSTRSIVDGCENDWQVICLGCGKYIYAPTQEQAETLWNDAMSARALRETKPQYNPDYLCGKPECEANVRGLVAEYHERIAELEAQVKVMQNCDNCDNRAAVIEKCGNCNATLNNWQPRPAIKEG